jgi:TolA-binding protein
MPPAAGDWLSTLTNAKTAATQGHFDDADHALYDFAQRYPGSPESREATYWRALFKLDPANRSGSPRAATERLDEYLADTAATLHRTEAATLRRIAAALDSLTQRPVAAAAPSDPARMAEAQQAAQRQDDLEKENQRLKDQLDKTNAELDRIKKRLKERTP